MDEKVKEIEEIKDRYNKSDGYVTAAKEQMASDIHFLLFHISSLEEQLNNLQSHANRMGEVIHDQTMKRIELEGEIEVYESQLKEKDRKIEELEANELRFPTLAEFSNLQDDHEKAEQHIQSLGDGIEKLLRKVNAITAPYRHGNPIPKSALNELSNCQIEIEKLIKK